MVKRGDQHHLEEPTCLHLVHYRVRDVITSCSPFPARNSWQGAEWKTNWLSKNDIVCKVNSSWNPTLECTVVDGSIQVGLTGTKLVFADSCSLRSENPDARLSALFTGFKVITELATELSSCAMRIWIVTDSKKALEWIWDNSRATISHKSLEETPTLISKVIGNLAINPTWAK